MTIYRARCGKLKGKIVKKSVKIAREKLINNLKGRLKSITKEEVFQNEVLEGRRIIELQTLAVELWCNSCDIPLSLRYIQHEQTIGLASILTIPCAKCKTVYFVHTNKKNQEKRIYDVNCKLAVALIDAGIGEAQINTILSELNIHQVYSGLLRRSEDIIGPAMDQVANESFEEAVKLEIALTEAKKLQNELIEESSCEKEVPDNRNTIDIEPLSSENCQEGSSKTTEETENTQNEQHEKALQLIDQNSIVNKNNGTQHTVHSLENTSMEVAENLDEIINKENTPPNNQKLKEKNTVTYNAIYETQSTCSNDSSEINSRAKQKNILSLRTENVSITVNKNTQRITRKKRLGGSIDVGWTKRGTGRTYNSTTGQGSLFGVESKKLMGVAVRQVICRKCAIGRHPNDHDCPINHRGSAKSMEPDMAVELIVENKILEKYDAEIGIIVQDNDSSSMAAIRRKSDVVREKWLDLNHAKKSFTLGLYKLGFSKPLVDYLGACYSCAIKKNKGNPDAVRSALKNIIPHAYGEHTNCGDWCRYKGLGNNYVYKNLPGGKPLQDADLRIKLNKLVDRSIKDAEKLAPCASSQSNESFNNVVASKNPKNKFFGGSKSFVRRVIASASQTNLGTKYVVDVNKKGKLSPGKNTQKFRLLKDKQRALRAQRQKTVNSKRRRLILKKERSQKSTAAENKEGITYESGCGFEDVSDILQNLQLNINDDKLLENSTPVVFDLETTGFGKAAEICQIAAYCNSKTFDAYIMPERSIPPVVTAVTGLKVIEGELCLNDDPVTVTPVRLAVTNFLDFLKAQGPSVILVAHNGFRFDAPLILRLITSLHLFEEFREVVAGFADTLPMFREKMPTRVKEKGSFKQENLVKEYLSPDCDLGAHNAKNDVFSLAKLMEKFSMGADYVKKHSRSLANQVMIKENAKQKADCKKSLEFLKDHVTSRTINKLTAAGIDKKTLIEAYNRGEDDEGKENKIKMLLATDNNKAPLVTKNKKIIKNIFEGLKKIIN